MWTLNSGGGRRKSPVNIFVRGALYTLKDGLSWTLGMINKQARSGPKCGLLERPCNCLVRAMAGRRHRMGRMALGRLSGLRKDLRVRPQPNLGGLLILIWTWKGTTYPSKGAGRSSSSFHFTESDLAGAIISSRLPLSEARGCGWGGARGGSWIGTRLKFRVDRI